MNMPKDSKIKIKNDKCNASIIKPQLVSKIESEKPDSIIHGNLTPKSKVRQFLRTKTFSQEIGERKVYALPQP